MCENASFQLNQKIEQMHMPLVHACLFVGVYHLHSNGDVTTAGEGLQILTYARHSWLMSSEGSLTCHTYFHAGHLVIMVISEDPWHSHPLPSVWEWICYYLFLRLTSGHRGWSSNSQPSACEANAIPHYATVAVPTMMKYNSVIGVQREKMTWKGDIPVL